MAVEIYCPECETLLGESRLANVFLYCKKCNTTVNSYGEINEIFKKCPECGRKIEQFFRKNDEGYFITTYNHIPICRSCWAKNHNMSCHVGITDYIDQSLEIWK